MSKSILKEIINLEPEFFIKKCTEVSQFKIITSKHYTDTH